MYIGIQMWFEHDGQQDNILSDLDGPAHFLLVRDHRTIGYFDPCWCASTG